MARTCLLLPLAVCATVAVAPNAWAGYSHYFTWRKAPDEVRLKACIQDLSRVTAAANESLAGPDGVGSPVVELLKIAFNGRAAEAHEPFLFPGHPGFNFCKTFAKPYDAAVTACLLVARDHFPPDTLEIRSDGDWQDWTEGARLYQHVFGRPALSPLSSPAPLGSDGLENDRPGPTTRELLLIGAVLAGFGVLVWLAFRGRYVFVVTIDRGAARLRRGKLAPSILAEMTDICSRCRVTRGVIRGFRAQNLIRLMFSSDIPADCCQQIRNMWTLSR
jgi:hypothetical protein